MKSVKPLDSDLEFIYEATDENIMPLGGMPIIDYFVKQTNLSKRLNAVPFKNAGKPIISNRDIILTMIGILAQGKFDFADADPIRKNRFFKDALHIHTVPSQETLRQRLDTMKPIVKDILDEESYMLIANSHMPLTPTYKDYIPVDIDVSPFDNSNTKKEGCNCTYKICDGFAPMFAYFGSEGYMLNCEFREGKQHSQAGTKEFLEECITRIQKVTDKKVLFRLDSGNDAEENMGLFTEKMVDFLCKRNLRRSKQKVIDQVLKTGIAGSIRREGRYNVKKQMYYSKTVEEFTFEDRKVNIYVYSRVKVILEGENGQQLLFPEYEIESYYSTLDVSVEDIMEIYHMHGTCEQFHSELKSDMGIERMPSGKFATNDLLLHIAMFTFNILRMIGQIAVAIGTGKRDKNHMVVRKRLGTVIKEIIMLAAKYVRHARRRYIKANPDNRWFALTTQIYKKSHMLFA